MNAVCGETYQKRGHVQLVSGSVPLHTWTVFVYLARCLYIAYGFMSRIHRTGVCCSLKQTNLRQAHVPLQGNCERNYYPSAR